MQSTPKEYAIYMLKPNAIEQGLAHTIHQIVESNQLKILKEKSVTLNKQEVEQLFLHPTQEYIAFLTKSPICIYLVKGIDPFEVLYNIKVQLRKTYSSDPIKNIIHTVDQGNEFHMLLKHFFSDLPLRQYCSLVDLNIKPELMFSPEKLLSDINDNTNLQFVSMNISDISKEQQHSLNKQIKRYKNIKIIYHFEKNPETLDPLSFYFYFKPSDLEKIDLTYILDNAPQVNLTNIKKSNNVTTYIDIPIISNQVLMQYRAAALEFKQHKNEAVFNKKIRTLKLFERIQQLKIKGITGLVCFKPSISLIETELRMDICRLLQLRLGGGSYGAWKPGMFSVSYNCIQDMPLFQQVN